MKTIWTENFDNSLTKVPKGQIGKLRIHKSGKMKLQLGNIIYDVLPGNTQNALEQVTAITEERKQIYNLGEISKRLLCIPDMENLLKND